MDVALYDPSGTPLNTLRRQLTHEFKFKPQTAGLHALCISHSMAYTNKTFDLDVSLTKHPEHPDNGEAGSSNGPASPLTMKLERTSESLQEDLRTLLISLRTLKNNEQRNLLTVRNVSWWVNFDGWFGGVLTCGLAVLQVVIIRMFFSGVQYVRV